MKQKKITDWQLLLLLSFSQYNLLQFGFWTHVYPYFCYYFSVSSHTEQMVTNDIPSSKHCCPLKECDRRTCTLLSLRGKRVALSLFFAHVFDSATNKCQMKCQNDNFNACALTRHCCWMEEQQKFWWRHHIELKAFYTLYSCVCYHELFWLWFCSPRTSMLEVWLWLFSLEQGRELCCTSANGRNVAFKW